MLIQGILSGAASWLSPISARATQPSATPPSAGGSAEKRSGPVPSANAGALRALAAQYDVSRITPREFSELIQRLREAKALGENDLQELAGIRVDLERAGVGPDEEIDLVDFYRRRLAQLQGTPATADSPSNLGEVEQARRRLDWLVRLALLHREPEASALAEVA